MLGFTRSRRPRERLLDAVATLELSCDALATGTVVPFIVCQVCDTGAMAESSSVVLFFIILRHPLLTMALCCIGGVCIPYSALLPLLVWGLRWLVEKMAAFGLLPKSLEAWLLTTLQIQSNKRTTDDCCKTEAQGSVSPSRSPDRNIEEVESMNDWNKLRQSNDMVVAKFSASWCSPCKAIQPLYASLAAKHTKAKFALIDVDDVDDVANQYKVGILPTFLVLCKGDVVERYSGSDGNKLQALIQTHVASAKR